MIHLHWHFFLTLIQLFSHDYFLFTQSIYFQMVFTQFIYLFFLNDSYLTCDFPPPTQFISLHIQIRSFSNAILKKECSFYFHIFTQFISFHMWIIIIFFYTIHHIFFIHISDTWYYFSHIIQSCHVLRFYGNFRP